MLTVTAVAPAGITVSPTVIEVSRTSVETESSLAGAVSIAEAEEIGKAETARTDAAIAEITFFVLKTPFY